MLGGMGPAAAVLFASELARHTDAQSDQGHVDAVILQHCSLPDRAATLYDSELCEGLALLLRSDARALVAAGATVLAMPCNTAHAWFNEVRAEVPPSVTVLDMVALVARRVALIDGDCVGVLATDVTRASGVYDRAFAKFGIRTVYPSREVREGVIEVIYGRVKRGLAADPALVGSALDELAWFGRSSVVLGCTELSVAVSTCTPTVLASLMPIVDVLRGWPVLLSRSAGRAVVIGDAWRALARCVTPRQCGSLCGTLCLCDGIIFDAIGIALRGCFGRSEGRKLMASKELFESIDPLRRRLQLAERVLAEEERSAGVSSRGFGATGKKVGSMKSSPTEAMFNKIEYLRASVENKKLALREAVRLAENMLETLPSPRWELELRRRYLDCRHADNVAREAGVSKRTVYRDCNEAFEWLDCNESFGE